LTVLTSAPEEVCTFTTGGAPPIRTSDPLDASPVTLRLA
jgi:hypothetical protein